MIDLSFLSLQPVAVFGLGKSGMATVAALCAAGRAVLAWDDAAPPREAAAALGARITDLDLAELTQAQMLVVGPGVPLTHPQPHPVVRRAQAIGVPVVGDVELLARALVAPRAGDRAAAVNPVVGITGTNGKSTTTALVGHILERAGRQPVLGGNLGPPVLGLEIARADQPVILELSSYQLDLMHTPCLSVAAWTNLTPDHLDRHGGMDGYLAAKRRILGLRLDDAAPLVIGVDDPWCEAVAAAAAQPVYPVSIGEMATGGVYALAGTLWDSLLSPDSPVVELSRLSTLRGPHNWQNAAIAYGICRALGLEPAQIADGLLSFRGLAHRQEQLGRLRGVLVVNDSKATNAEATAPALRAFPRIRWILGGRPKAGGLAGLGPSLGEVRSAYVIGEAAEDFAAWLNRHAPELPVWKTYTLERAVEAALADAEPGDTLLLSPAAASFDQFTSFETRGDAFRALIAQAMAAAGDAAEPGPPADAGLPTPPMEALQP